MSCSMCALMIMKYNKEENNFIFHQYEIMFACSLGNFPIMDFDLALMISQCSTYLRAGQIQ